MICVLGKRFTRNVKTIVYGKYENKQNNPCCNWDWRFKDIASTKMPCVCQMWNNSLQAVEGLCIELKQTDIWAWTQRLIQGCICVQLKLTSARTSAQSDQSLRGPPENALHYCLPTECPLKLIRRRWGTGWSVFFWAHLQFYRKCCAPTHISKVHHVRLR